MRSLVVTCFVAFAVAFGAVAAGWSLEASALPAPAPGDRAAVDGLVVLDQHRFVRSALRVDGGPAVDAGCRRGWFPRHGTLLTLSNGARVFDPVGHDDLSAKAAAELLLGGCPKVLANTVARLLQNGAPALAKRVWLGGPALAVHISKLTLYLTQKHDVPIGVAIRDGSVTGSSRLTFAS